MSSLLAALSLCVNLLENRTQDFGLQDWPAADAEFVTAPTARYDTVRYAHEGGVWAVELTYVDYSKHDFLSENGVSVDEPWRCEVFHAPGAVDANAQLEAAKKEFVAGIGDGIWTDVTGHVDVAAEAPGMIDPRAFLFCGTSGVLELVTFGSVEGAPGDVSAIVAGKEIWEFCEE